MIRNRSPILVVSYFILLSNAGMKTKIIFITFTSSLTGWKKIVKFFNSTTVAKLFKLKITRNSLSSQIKIITV